MTELKGLEKLGKVVETDILIVGGGPSGLWTASLSVRYMLLWAKQV